MNLSTVSRLPINRIALLLIGGLAAACQSKTDSGTTATKPIKKETAAPVQDAPGAWYRCYRGTLGAETITLHLQALPGSPENRNRVNFIGSYSGPDGKPYDVGSDYDAVITPDSVIVRDRSLELLDDNANGPIWRLRINGKELLGTRAGVPVQLRETEQPGTTAFVSRYFIDSVAAYPNKPTSPHGRTSLYVLLPTNGPESARSTLTAGILRSLRGDTLDTEAAPASAEQFWEQQRNQFQQSYRQSIAELIEDRPAEPDTSSAAPSYDYTLRYEDQLATHVLWNQQNLLSLGFFGYSYTGGAHGNYGTTARTFDARTGRVLRFQDIFRPDSEAQLSPLLEQEVRRVLREPTAPLNEFLFVEKMPVSHNVYLTTGGAVFIYVPYEIAAFAQGEIRLFVPLERLRPLLKPNLPVNGGEVSRR